MLLDVHRKSMVDGINTRVSKKLSAQEEAAYLSTLVITYTNDKGEIVKIYDVAPGVTETKTEKVSGNIIVSANRVTTDRNSNLTVTSGTGKPTTVKVINSTIGFDFVDAGEQLGSILGNTLVKNNVLGQVVASAALKTIGANLGDALNLAFFDKGGQAAQAVHSSGGGGSILANIDGEFLANLKSAGIGALSSFLTAELVHALGVDGFAGDLLNTAAGAAIGQIVTNIANGANVLKSAELFANVNPTMIATAVGSFLGAKLASEIISFDTIGGQIGSAVGATLGVIAAEKLGLFGAIVGGPVGALIGAAIGAFLGFIVGGLIGSIFGGTPRSGADVAWDEQKGEFSVANAYARKGGSKDTAASLASVVSDTFNNLLVASGSRLANPELVQTGNYGMWKSDFVYRPVSTRDEGAITRRFSGKDGAGKLIAYGIYQGLADPDFQLVGGDIYVKRAIYRTLEVNSVVGAEFDLNVLIGNITAAQRYSGVVGNEAIVSSLVRAEEGSVFTAEVAIAISAAHDLGINKRHASDWFGGFQSLLDEAGASSAEVFFRFVGNGAGSISRRIDIGNYTFVDGVSVDDLTTIETFDGVQVIDLRSGSLANQIGYTVNGRLNNDIALGTADFVVKSENLSIASGTRSIGAIVATPQDSLEEADEKFNITLSNAAGVSIVGPAATVTIVSNSALPTLMVGRSFAGEGDGYAVFRVGLSKAATTAVTMSLALTDGRATGGADYGTTLQISTDGITGWTNATSLTLAAGIKDYFVRIAVIADNGVDAEGHSTNIEGNETFTLTATVTAGTAALASGTSPVSGKGTIIDGTSPVPYVWIDDVVHHEGQLSAAWINSSKVASGTATVQYTTSDRTKLDISIAATVDAGDGNDTVYASNLGDNIFGGAGNDTLYGGRLDDWLLGGAGDDVLDAGTVAPEALGGDGNYLDGGAGNDILRGREGSDWLEGGDGIDVLTGGAGDDILAGGAGEGDDLKGGIGDDQYLVRLGDGADIAEDEAAGAPVAQPGGDYISQRFAGLLSGIIKKNWAGGAAGVTGKALQGGEDAIVFGQGIDMGNIMLVRSSTDSDDLIVRVMQTVDGVVSFSGTQLTVKNWFSDPFKRIEWLKFADGNEVRIGDITSFIIGGSGNDVLIGTAGNDFVYGGGGNDALYLMGGNDIGNGGTGNDMVAGDSGRDLLLGGLGADELIGGKGADVLSGDGGGDDLYGGNDADILSGGRGDGDQVVGGAGDDIFKYARGDGRDMMFDDFSANWQIAWTNGVWNATAGYTYNSATGEVTGPGGTFIRKNVGTAANPDLQWLGRFDYDSEAGTLRHFNPPAGASIVANAGIDTIEFAPGINIQDIVLWRPAGSNDLVLSIGSENTEFSAAGSIADSITIKDWYLSPGQIEKLAFYQTGILDISAGATNLIAGTDAANGTTAAPLAGTVMADWMTGGAGDDVLAGGLGNDIIVGNSGSDTLKGESGDDVIYGGAGNDSLDGGAGQDVLIGGSGLDTASYLSASAGVKVYLSGAVANTGDAAGDTFSSIENLAGGGGGDVLGGDDYDNELTGGQGDDTLLGGEGDDTYLWNVGDGADIIRDASFAIEEAVTASGTLAAGYTQTLWQCTWILQPGYWDRYYWRLQVTGPNGEVVYDYDRFAPNNADANQPDTPPAAYNVAGWLGGFAKTYGQQVTREKFDTTTDAGDDVLEFGAGVSLSDLSFITSGADLVVQFGGSATSQITIRNQFTPNGRIETLQFRDGLAVSLASVLTATNGAVLNGTSGDDLMMGQAGALADQLNGGAGHDVLSGGAGDDVLTGGDGDDQLEGGAGADRLDGGTHSATTVTSWGDTARYVRSAAGVQVDLRNTTTGQTGGDAAGDVLTGIENLTGSAFNDTLTGDDNGNRIDGLDGNNTLYGNGGGDVLVGGSGIDRLYGGAGDDAIAGGAGSDDAYGGDGNDRLDGGDGNDYFFGEAGNDSLTGGEGNDSLDGGDGDDIISGGNGIDNINGGGGKDTIDGGAGDDTLAGGDGDDVYIFGALSGRDAIIDMTGKNNIVFDSSVSFDQLWFSRSGTELQIGIIGSTTRVLLQGYFAPQYATLMRSVSTTTHTLFLGYATPLIDAMTAIQIQAPGAMPEAIKTQLAAFWYAGGKAPPQAAPIEIAINEDGATGLTSVGAIDPDENIQSYALGTAPTNGAVVVNALDGKFIYTPNADFNGEDRFSIMVKDADGQAKDVAVKVMVAAANDAPRNLRLANEAILSVVEGGPGSPTLVDSPIAQFVATDVEGDSFTFSLTDDAGGRFEITAAGLLIARDPARLNFEAAPSHVVGVRVVDSHGASSETRFTVSLQDRNEANSMHEGYGMSVSENVAVGTAVGTVAADDIDGVGTAFGQQRYYFLNGGAVSGTSADGRYTIDALTGVIKTASTLNFEAGTTGAMYTVVARDNQGLAGYREASSSVGISVTDANEANALPATYAMSVVENVAVGTSVGTVVATDIDSLGTAFGQQRYYFLNAGVAGATSSDGRYTIDAVSGVIRTAAALNFEAGTTSVSYTVVARDNQGLAGYTQASSTVTIGVTDGNEANAIPATYAMSVAENVAVGTSVGTVAATDLDSVATPFGQQRYYFLNAGVAGATSSDGRYTIDAMTGVIKTAAALNFEAGTTSVAYTVVARDNQGLAGYAEASSTVTIDVADVNEANAIPASYTMSVAENVAIGTSVGTVAATDIDGAGTIFGQQRYYFLNAGVAGATSSDGRYAIDAVSGVIKTAAALNFEAGTTSVAYTVVARDNQGLGGYTQASSTVTIGVTDGNEANAIPATYTMLVAENVAIGTNVGTVVATDIDSVATAFGQQRYYFLNGSTVSATSSDGRYAIDAMTGVIKTAAALNFEAGTTSVAYTVVARDNQGLAGYTQASSTVTIGVTDANEANAIPATYAMSVAENAAIGSSVGAVAATDLDGAGTIFGQQRYYFLNAGVAGATSSDGRYAINAVSGLITTATLSNFEVGATSASYTVIARDNQGAAGYTEASSTVTIGIADVNEANSIPATYAMTVAENVAIGTNVGTVAATDIDDAGSAFGQQRYYFLNAGVAGATSSDGRYTIDAVSGVIKTAATLNFEAGTTSVAYTVVARDNQGLAGYIQASSTVTIGVTDANEANAIPATYAMSVAENVAIGTSVGTVAASDLDGAGTIFAQQRYYFLSAGVAGGTSSDGRYTIDAVSGVIKTAAALNFEAGATSVAYTVVARDNQGLAGYTQASSTVTIGIADVNEANAIPATYAMTVAENVAIGTNVGTVAATDIDDAGVAFGQQRYYFLNAGVAGATSSDGRYTIDAVSGVIKTAAALNFEAGTTSVAYTVIARDNQGLAGYIQASSTVTIGVTDANEAPSVLNWAPSVSFVVERDRVASGTSLPAISLGSFAVVDPDTAGTPNSSYSYSVSDSRFEIVGDVLRLKLGAVLDFEASSVVAITVTATDQTATPFSIQRSIDIVVTDQDDVLEGDANANTLTGQQNRDRIYGLGGNDTLDGGAGDDRLEGGAGVDRLIGGAGADTLYGGDDSDTLIGGIGNDALYGGNNTTGVTDFLYGDDGDDLLYGEDGDDYLTGGNGADQLVGGAGVDYAAYQRVYEGVLATTAVTVDLATPSANTGAAAGDTYVGIEGIVGSPLGDTLLGDATANILLGIGGADTLRGRAGDDLLNGGAGNDILYGDDGADTLYGENGDDIIYGGAGNDVLIGGAGNDTLNAESGDDFLDGGAGNDILTGGVDNDTYVVTRASDADTIYNYDPSGDDIDVLGFQDTAGAIAHEDLWFERVGDDMRISVIGSASSVLIKDWYLISDPASRANYRVDFIVAGERYSTSINVEGLVGLMASKTKPATAAARDTLMGDLTYKAQWATHWGSNAAPVLSAIADQTINEDTTLSLTVTATDDITPNAGLQLSATVLSGSGLIAASGLVFGAPNAAGQRSLTITPNGNASGVATIRVQAIDAGGVISTEDFSVTVNSAPDQPVIAQFAGGSGTSGLAGIPLNLSVTFPDTDGSEVQEIWIAGVPVGVTLSAGTYDNSASVWKLSPAQASGLQVIAPAGWSQDLSLTVTARATEGGQTAISTATTTTVIVNAPPTSLAFSGSVDENAANAVTIGTVTAVDPDSGDTLIYSLLDNAGGRFSLTTTGTLKVANSALFNYESATSHSIVVRVTDSFGQFRDQTFTVAVNNLNEANSIPATYTMSVAENVAVGTSVGTVAATDLDSATTAFGQQRYYFLNAGVASGTSSDGRYTIDAATGVIKTAAALNFEAGTTSVAYTVAARDNQGNAGYTQATSTVTIGVTDVNEANAIPATYAMSVAENVGIGTSVGTVAATDLDGAGTAFGQQRYYFLNAGAVGATSSDGRYTIDAITGVIKTAATLNFEAGTTSVSYTVVARDNQGAAGYTQAASTVTINVADVNEANAIPATYAMSVVENVAVGTSVGTVAATDLDSVATPFGQQRYYFLNAGVAGATSADGRYTIDAVSGVIKTAAILNFEAGTTSVAYTVVARDNQGLAGYTQASSTVTIDVTDVNEANAIPATYAMSVAENVGIGTSVGTVVATDIDSVATAFGQQRYYFLNAGVAGATSSDGRYTIDAITGVIKTAATLNFEAGTTSVAYTVVARDNQGAAGYTQATSTVTIGVTDMNEANAIPATYAMSVAENVGIGTSVGTVAATDLDGAGTAFGQQRYYFLNAGVAGATSSDGRYAIDAITGVIKTAAALNFEAGTTSVAYTVVAHDNQGAAGYIQAASTVTIGVTDSNEANAIPASYAMSVAENVAVGTSVGSVAATDLDGVATAFGQQRYYFLNGSTASATSSDGRYTIDAVSGVIKTATVLNFEAGTTSVAYTVVARDNQGAAGYIQAASTVTIGVADANEANAIPATYAMSVAENVGIGTSVGTVVATDIDSVATAFGQQRYYFLDGSTPSATSSDGRYTIDAITGVIKTAATLNFEAGTTSVAYTVVARDNQGAAGYIQAASTVTIGVTDANEANAIPASYAMSVAENVAVGTSVGSVAATDIDSVATAFGQQRYYFLNAGVAGGTSSDGRYTIDALTGVIRTAAVLNFEAGTTSVSYTVVARDNQGAAGYTQAASTVTINVADVNEANAIPATYAMSVAENVAVGTSVGTVAATDLDGVATAFGQQRYYFLNGSTASATSSDGRYTIDAVSGVIKTAAILNFEAGTTSVAYTVVARDNQGAAGYTQATSTVTIGVADANEANAIPATYAMSVAENVGIGTSVGTVVATDIDSVATAFGQQRYYFLNAGVAGATSSDGRYTIDAITGVIKTAAMLNFEAGTTSVAYTVVARDNQGAAGYTQATSTVTIDVTDANEANAIPATYAMSVAENVGIGTSVGTVAATDLDGAGTAFGQQRYYFLDGSTASGTSSDGRYTIDALTGLIRTAAVLNFEAGTTSVAYTVVARDNQGAAGYIQASSTVTIGVTDMNEANAIPASYVMSVSENGAIGTNVGTVAATDIDGAGAAFGQQRYYFLSGSAVSAISADGRYAIDAVTGLIRTAAALNFEAGATSVAYTVVARDNQGSAGYNQTSSTVTIGITDTNEANAMPASYGMAVTENVAIGTSVGTVAATDLDSAGGTFGQQRYYFLNNGSASAVSFDGRYAIDEVSGAIRTAAALDFEIGTPSVAYTVAARDNQGNAGFNQTTSAVTIGITDVNERHTLLSRSYASIEEGSQPPENTVVDARLMLNDPEGRTMQWRFADGGTESGIWKINGSTGEISLIAGSVDYEGLTEIWEEQEVPRTGNPNRWEEIDPVYEWVYRDKDPSRATFNLAVTATDLTPAPDGTYFTSTGIATISVTDRNEGPILTSRIQYYVKDDQEEGDIPFGLTARDPETRSDSGITFQILGFQATEYLISSTGPELGDIGGEYPELYLTPGGQLSFQIPGDGEWEGGVEHHAEGGRRTFFLDYLVNVLMTDPSGVSSTASIKITFVKQGRNSSIPPLVLDLDGDGIELVAAANSSISFDMDLDGIADRTGWVGGDDGMLALDRNGNGTIDDSSEISFIADAAGATSDLEGLRAFDSNANGFFDSGDARFGEFRIWRDINQDGISQTSELQTLSGLGIVQINLSLDLTGAQSTGENLIYGTTQYLRSDGTTGIAGDVFLAYDPSKAYSIAPPVILDFDGDGAGLMSLASSNVRFDMDGDGAAERTGWIEAGDAFLALDRNGDGKISDIAEISFVGDLAGAKTDLEGLKAFDSNGDGLLSALDARFAEFKLWFDTNSNGVSDAGEIRSLAEAGLASLSLSSTAPTRASGDENIIYGVGNFTRSNGQTGTLLDVGLAYVRGDGGFGSAVSSWTGDATPSTSNAPRNPAINVERQIFTNKSGKYMLSTLNGAVHVRSRKGDVDERSGLVGPATVLEFKNETFGVLTPFILDLDGDGVETRSMGDSKARFDMSGDGLNDDVGWVGKGDGFLVIDRNGDGLITEESELTFLSEKTNAASGLDGLAVLDSNKDGKIDATDTRFGELRVWVDRDGDGVTDAGELKTLAEHGIASVSLSARALNQNVKVGANAVAATSTFTRVNGAVGTLGAAVLAYRPTRMRTTDPVPTALSSGLGTRPAQVGRELDNGVVENSAAQVPVLSLAANGPGEGVQRSQDLPREPDVVPGTVAKDAGQPVLASQRLEAQFAALRRGLEGDLLENFIARMPIASLAANDVDERAQGAQDLPQEQAPSGPVEMSDLRPLLIAQTMAAFGARSGEGDWRERAGREAAHFDYFAA
ncbi:cadherin domain-containing protein [Sphingomonas sp. QA11]|uniref:cadherin domain-containing protein n=1 Tax=Sphingomonas sp. QA11 TaxID=2950605 RepID=UPI00234B9E98|nr:cadherin domain-containing protein [Sphingomonas sp. QA11]WCM25838.1 cadherin domain-containing protein [Sphingomonas sp. QA11]